MGEFRCATFLQVFCPGRGVPFDKLRAGLKVIKVNRYIAIIADINKTITTPERSVGQAFLGALIFERTKPHPPPSPHGEGAGL